MPPKLHGITIGDFEHDLATIEQPTGWVMTAARFARVNLLIRVDLLGALDLAAAFLFSLVVDVEPILLFDAP